MITPLDIAQAGYSRFPLSPGSKVPLPGSNGLKDATSELAIAKTHMVYSNHGIATGHDYLVVLDVDADKSGQTQIADSHVWKKICAVLGSETILSAMQVGTPNGGVHLYLRCDAPIKSGTDVLATPDGVRLDIRAVGGYVVAPGSIIDGRQYATNDGKLLAIDQLPIVELPKLQRIGCARKQQSPISTPPSGVTPASHNLNANPLTLWQHVATAAAESGNLNLDTNDGFETLTKALAYAVREEGHPIEEVWKLLDELCSKHKNYNQAGNRRRFDSFVGSKPDNPVTLGTLRFLAEAPPGVDVATLDAMDLEQAKDRFLFVRNFMGGPVYIDQNNPAHPMSVKAFEDGYDQQVTLPNGKSMRLGVVFKKYPKLRKSVDKMVFDPTKPHGVVVVGKGMEAWNSYRAPEFPLSPSQLSLEDRCEKIWKFIYHVICGNEVERWNYLFNWLAWNVQNPGSKPEVAVALNGPQGCGKSTMVLIFARLLAPHIICSKKEQVFGRFNDHLREKLAIGLEEAFWAGDPNAEDQIKTLITEHEILYERKNKTPESAPSFHRLMLASNHAHAIPASWDERRYFMLSVKGGAYDTTEWKALNKEIEGEGLAAFYQLLMQHQLGAWHPRDSIPKTRALGEQKLLSLGVTYEGFLLHMLSDEALPSSQPNPSNPAMDWKAGPITLSPLDKDNLIKQAEEWRKGQNKGRHAKPFAKGPLMKALKKYFGASDARGAGKRDWEIPNHAVCVRNFAAELGVDETSVTEI